MNDRNDLEDRLILAQARLDKLASSFLPTTNGQFISFGICIFFALIGGFSFGSISAFSNFAEALKNDCIIGNTHACSVFRDLDK